MGHRGNGSTRGTCQEGHLCGDRGKCLKACSVQGKAGNGLRRGSCQENFFCWSSGECRKGKTSFFTSFISVCTLII